MTAVPNTVMNAVARAPSRWISGLAVVSEMSEPIAMPISVRPSCDSVNPSWRCRSGTRDNRPPRESAKRKNTE